MHRQILELRGCFGPRSVFQRLPVHCLPEVDVERVRDQLDLPRDTCCTWERLTLPVERVLCADEEGSRPWSLRRELGGKWKYAGQQDTNGV